MKGNKKSPFPALPALEPLQPGDVRQISSILVSMDPWLTLGYGTEALSHYLLRADPALRRYCLKASGALAGVLTLRHPWLFGPFIELIALFDDFRGKGFGREVIDWICREFPDSPNLWATVSSFNPEAQKFYPRLGFENTAVLPDLIRPGRDEILLRKRI